MEYEISLEPGRMQLDLIHQFLVTSYWSPKIRRDVLKAAFSNSLVAGAFVRVTGEQIGVARVITDYATFAYLCDVFVKEKHRGRGVARQMLAELMNSPQLKTLKKWCLATRDAHELYRQLGFTLAPSDRCRELKLPPSNWQEVES
jgi:GNAT superfamily N-acetyltransferase